MQINDLLKLRTKFFFLFFFLVYFLLSVYM